jgi:hypothetical protein
MEIERGRDEFLSVKWSTLIEQFLVELDLDLVFSVREFFPSIWIFLISSSGISLGSISLFSISLGSTV